MEKRENGIPDAPQGAFPVRSGSTARESVRAALRERFGDRFTCSVSEAGDVMGISRATSYESARRGDLPTIRMNGRLLVSIAALEQILSNH